MLQGLSARLKQLGPVRSLFVGYLLYGAIGWALLSLPWMLEGGVDVAPIDNLFTAFSAMSTTGLATVSTPASYSFAGELVILLLIQVGGLGYMTMGSFVLMATKRLPEERAKVAEAGFSLPEGVRASTFLRRVVIYTLAVESAGAGLLYLAFSDAGVDGALWQAIFHSVSAFCTAGFSLFSDSLEGFQTNFAVNAIVAALSLAGAIGFLVVHDAVNAATNPKHRITLTTRVILATTFWVIAAGTAVLFLAEASFFAMAPETRLLTSFFQAMTALTTVGFNTYPIGNLAAPMVFAMLLLMILGASPAGTGGGLKSTSVSTALAAAGSALRGQDHISFRGCEIPQHRIMNAYAALVFYVGTLGLGCFLLLLLESFAFEDVVFEAASALGTVGLSRGITGDLQPLSKIIVIVMMFIGRLGPLTFGLAMFRANAPEDSRREDLAV